MKWIKSIKRTVNLPLDAEFFICEIIMATWVHRSMYLLFVINLSSFKLFHAESAVFRTASIKHTNLKSTKEEIHFSLKKWEKRKKNDFNFT